MSKAITEEELLSIKSELCDLLGNPMSKPAETADFATRALQRVLGEALKLKRENARLRSAAKIQVFAQG